MAAERALRRRGGGREIAENGLGLLAGKLVADAFLGLGARQHGARLVAQPRHDAALVAAASHGGEVEFSVTRQRQFGTVGLGAPQELGAAVLGFDLTQQRGARKHAVALLDLIGAERIGGADDRIELAAALLGTRQGDVLALLEIGLLVRQEIARAGGAQRFDGRLRCILVGNAVDLDRLAERVAAANPRRAVQAKDVFGIGRIEQKRRITGGRIGRSLRGCDIGQRERHPSGGQQDSDRGHLCPRRRLCRRKRRARAEVPLRRRRAASKVRPVQGGPRQGAEISTAGSAAR